jgi:hypothetical protein
MNVSMHIEEVEVSVSNLYKDVDNTQVININNENSIDLYFRDIKHLKEFASNLNKAIKEVE